MILVIPFSNADAKLAVDLLAWIKLLGGTQNYACLLVADAATDWNKAMAAMEIARSCFGRATIITNEVPVQGWPLGANSLFTAAAKHINETTKSPFLWLEPDAIPIKQNWLQEIEKEYYAEPKAQYMGHVYSGDTPGLAPRLMSGISVYSGNDLNASAMSAWDVRNADDMVKNGKHTELIHHFWGQRNLSPTFAEVKAHDSPINVFTLESIKPKAAIFHRCKDGSLIQLLKKKLFPNLTPKLLVVLPFCGKDAECALRNVQWIQELGGATKYHALVSYDDQTSRAHVNAIIDTVQKTFTKTDVHAYRLGGAFTWPHGPNHAFQTTARYIEQQYRIPWLWLEADAVPIKPNWLDELFAAYQQRGKRLFGPIVPGRGHINGVAIYPFDMATRCPRAMSATNIAWDMFPKDEMPNDFSDGQPLIDHVWGLHHGQPHPIEGSDIRFNSLDDVNRWVHPDALIFHRSKAGDLQTLLRQRNGR